MIIAIDPGTEQSAIVAWDGESIGLSEIHPNNLIKHLVFHTDARYELAIERVASYGMAVGKDVFETCEWIGRFDEAWRTSSNKQARLIYRRDVKLHLCQSARAKDANIRQALIDRFGPPGTKKQPGITYGIKSHLWAAFALAVFAYDTQTLFTPNQQERDE